MSHIERRGRVTVIAMGIIAAIAFVGWARAGWSDLPHAVDSKIIDRREWPEPIVSYTSNQLVDSRGEWPSTPPVRHTKLWGDYHWRVDQ